MYTLISTFIIFFVLSIPTVLFAATYYVAPDGQGSDSNPGTLQEPWATETKAENTVQPGDTVYFLDGKHTLDTDAKLAPITSGTDGNPITFAALNQGKATLYAPTTSPLVASTQGYDYIVFDGFKVEYRTDNTQGPEIQPKGNHNIVKNCIFRANVTDPATGNNAAIYVPNDGASNLLVKNNYIEGYKGRLGHEGICLYNTEDSIFEKNTIKNCHEGITFKTNETNCTIRKNHIYDIESRAITLYTGDDETLYQRDININQNIIHNVGDKGIYLYVMSDLSQVTENTQIYNNVVYNTKFSLFQFNSSRVNNTQIHNNIFVDARAPYAGVYDDDSVGYSDYNCFYNWEKSFSSENSTFTGWQNESGWDLNSLNQRPQFINAGGNSTKDYKLQSGSLAINAGLDRQDYDNDSNTTESINMGAYITGNEQIGYVPEPNSPSNLNIKK